MFLRLFLEKLQIYTMFIPVSLVLWDDVNQSYNRDNNGVKLTIIAYTIDSNFYEKISLCYFYRKISRETPIETKQETFRSRLKEEHTESITRRQRTLWGGLGPMRAMRALYEGDESLCKLCGRLESVRSYEGY